MGTDIVWNQNPLMMPPLVAHLELMLVVKKLFMNDLIKRWGKKNKLTTDHHGEPTKGPIKILLSYNPYIICGAKKTFYLVMGSEGYFQAPTFFGSKNSFTMFHRLVDPFNPAQAQRVVTPLVTRCAAAHPRFVRETGQARLPRFRRTCGLEMFGVSRVLDNNPQRPRWVPC